MKQKNVSLRANRTQEQEFQTSALGALSHGVSSTPTAYQSLNFKGIDISYVDVPTLITQFRDEIVFDISAGSKHSVFCCLSDKVYSCGSGLQGQLGLGAFTQQVARDHQDPEADKENEPEYVTDVRLLQHMFVPDTRIKMFDHIKVKAVSCGRYHTLFLTQEGEVYACG